MSRAAFAATLAFLASAGLSACSRSGAEQQSPQVQNAVSVRFPYVLQNTMFLPTVSSDPLYPGPSAVVAIAWSPDGSRLVAASDYGGTLTVWDTAGRKVAQFTRAGEAIQGSIVFTRGHDQLIFPGPQGTPEYVASTVWDIATGRPVRNIGKPEPGVAVTMNDGQFFCSPPDQSYLAVGRLENSFHRNVDVYRLTDDKMVYFAKLPMGVESIACFGGGRFVVAGTDMGVDVIDVGKGSPPRHYQVYKKVSFGDENIGAVAGSPDGSLIFAGTQGGEIEGPYSNDPRAAAWENSQPLAEVLRLSDGRVDAWTQDRGSLVNAVAWDPMGRYVAFTGAHDSLILWRPFAEPQSYARVTISGKARSLSISPDGETIAVATLSGVLIFQLRAQGADSPRS